MENNSVAFEVRYSKRRQEAQFEPDEAEIKAVFGADFAANGDPVSFAEDKLRQCRDAVRRVLGLTPAVAGSSTADKAASIRTEPTTAQVPKDTSEKKRAGRPSNAELAKRAAERALANADPMAEAIAEKLEEDAPQGIQTGESREQSADPMQDFMDLPDAPQPTKSVAEEVKNITDQELQNEAGKANLRLGDPRVIKGLVSKNYRVQKLGDVPQNLRASLVNDLRNLQKDGTTKKAETK